MDAEDITQYIRDHFADVDVFVGSEGIAAGDRFFYFAPEGTLDIEHQFPFATIVTKDYGEFDSASNLNRPGVFRLNIGVSQNTFRTLFGPPPDAPDAAGTSAHGSGDGAPAGSGHDFTALDVLLPHPVYAPQSWVCVLNPTAETLQRLQPLIAEAHERAEKRFHATTPDAER